VSALVRFDQFSSPIRIDCRYENIHAKDGEAEVCRSRHSIQKATNALDMEHVLDHFGFGYIPQ
jgi:hypothetical protein